MINGISEALIFNVEQKALYSSLKIFKILFDIYPPNVVNYLTISPYLLDSCLLSKHINTNNMIKPTKGMIDIKTHHPFLLMSCNRLTHTAKDGKKVAKP